MSSLVPIFTVVSVRRNANIPLGIRMFCDFRAKLDLVDKF